MTYSAKRHIKSVTNLIDYTFNAQAISTTVTAYDGTEITYTPADSAVKVIIEVNLVYSWQPDYSSTLLSTRLEESTDNGVTWSALSGYKAFEGNTGGHYNFFNSPYFFTLPAYTGSKKFRLSGRSHSTGTEYTMGIAFDNSSTERDCPAHISIYSVED